MQLLKLGPSSHINMLIALALCENFHYCSTQSLNEQLSYVTTSLLVFYIVNDVTSEQTEYYPVHQSNQ